MILTERFQRALEMALHLHMTQKRKGTDVPYIAHLMGVSSMVLTCGGGEDEAIAGLLHDAVEDQGGLETLQKIREWFGDKVADMVMECSDAWVYPKPPWKERKTQFIKSLKSKSLSSRLIILADKIFNLWDILYSFRCVGERVFDRFSHPREDTFWYYDSIIKEFKEIDPNNPLLKDLECIFETLKREANIYKY